MSHTDPQTTVLDALTLRLDRAPDGPYLDFEGTARTARDVDGQSSRLAAALAGRGVHPGDRVATLLENGPEQVLSFFAPLKLAAIQVPINTAYKGEFLRHQLVDSGARVVIVQGDFASRVAAVTHPAPPELETAVVCGLPDAAIDGVAVFDWAAFLDSAAGPAPTVTVGPSD